MKCGGAVVHKHISLPAAVPLQLQHHQLHQEQQETTTIQTLLWFMSATTKSTLAATKEGQTTFHLLQSNINISVGNCRNYYNILHSTLYSDKYYFLMI